jgi:hypothetical protein
MRRDDLGAFANVFGLHRAPVDGHDNPYSQGSCMYHEAR